MSHLRVLQLRELSECDVLDSSNVANIATRNGGLTLNNPGPANAPVFSSQLFANLNVNDKGELIVSGDNIVNLNAYALPGVPTTTAETPALVVNVVSGAGIVGKYYLPLWTL
jgi:hypothetical protein